MNIFQISASGSKACLFGCLYPAKHAHKSTQAHSRINQNTLKDCISCKCSVYKFARKYRVFSPLWQHLGSILDLKYFFKEELITSVTQLTN